MYQYPYGDSQQLNLDWIINKLIELEQSFVPGESAELEEFANALISLTYIPTQAYNNSDIVFHDGHLYRCNTTIPAPGEVWDPSHWDQIMLGNTVANLVRAVAGMNSDHVFNESNVNGTHVTEALNALVEDVRYDNHKIQQKKNGAYTDVILVEDTPSNNSDRLASSKAAYDLNGAINASLKFKRELSNGDDLNALYENGWYLTGSSHSYLNSPIPNDSGQREIFVTGGENPTATSYRIMYYANRTRKIYAHRVFASGSWTAWNIFTDNLNYKRCLLIGDSYNNGNGGISGQGWGYYFQQFTGCDATIVHQNGGGFAIAGNSNATYPNKTYAQCVSEINGEYDIVIAQSGWNDAGQATESQITTAVSSFVTAARAKWQNAKIYVISTNNGTDTTYTKANKLKAISNAALENDVVSSLYSPYWLIGKNVAATDGIHLNDDGYQLLAHYIIDYVSGWDGVIEANNYYNAPNEDRIPPSTVTVGANVNCYFNNSFCTISFDVTLTQTESSWVTTVQNLPIPRAYLIQTIGNWNATYQRPIRAEIGNDGTLRIRYGEAGNYRILMTYPL